MCDNIFLIGKISLVAFKNVKIRVTNFIDVLFCDLRDTTQMIIDEFFCVYAMCTTRNVEVSYLCAREGGSWLANASIDAAAVYARERQGNERADFK